MNTAIANIPLPASRKYTKKYKQQHVTTAGFMMPSPVMAREVVPDRNMKVSSFSFIRCNPMVTPPFGTCKVNNRAFFVPFRTVWRPFNSFLGNTYWANAYDGEVHTEVPPHVPSVSNLIFIKLFTTASYLLADVTTDSSDYDFAFYTSQHSQVLYKLTNRGIQWLKIIESLGYKIIWNEEVDAVRSALPLMCWAKVMMDWYYPSAYVGSQEYVKVEGLFNSNTTEMALQQSHLYDLLSICEYCTYEPDYFTSAFDNPVGQNNLDINQKISFRDISNNSNYPQLVTNDDSLAASPSSAGFLPSNGTPFIGGSNSVTSTATSGVSTQYVIDVLKSLTDWTKRHQLSGLRQVDRVLTEYGVSLKDEILRRSMFLGVQSYDFNFTDVMSHTDTENGNQGRVLGAYAGKGTATDTKEFSLENQPDFGLFIIVNTVVPNASFFEGVSRELAMHVYPMDFYRPDFDHMGVQPISTDEVYTSLNGYAVSSDPSIVSTIFGYAPRYVEYNLPINQVTGLFRIPTQKGLLESYIFARKLNYELLSPANMKHNIGLVLGQDSGQFNRVFYSEKLDQNFICFYQFDVTNIDTTLPAYDTYEFDHPENEKISLTVNGAKMN